MPCPPACCSSGDSPCESHVLPIGSRACHLCDTPPIKLYGPETRLPSVFASRSLRRQLRSALSVSRSFLLRLPKRRRYCDGDINTLRRNKRLKKLASR